MGLPVREKNATIIAIILKTAVAGKTYKIIIAVRIIVREDSGLDLQPLENIIDESDEPITLIFRGVVNTVTAHPIFATH